MLINVVPGEECRIALVRDGQLEDYFHERASAQSHVSNIYKGRVTNVEPAIQAAFVDFGLERNGFLHISDLHPKYFPGEDREAFEKVGHKTARRDRPPIQKCLKRGDQVLVQVIKEGISNKGPTLTSYLSIPGRFLVMMPDMQKLGVSRKVEDDDARKETRKLLAELDPPEGFGFIIRTAGVGQTKTDLKRDLAYLQRLWKSIAVKQKKRRGVGELYAETDLIVRTLRDAYTNEIDRILIDDRASALRASDFLAVASPRSKSKVFYVNDPVPLFTRHGLEPQIAAIGTREVPLPSGGALVIDQTEALVAIDVNSGKSRSARDAETNAYKTNQEAVDEIARQLRLRDLGGLVVLDLIDMDKSKNRKAIETRFKNHLKNDRARTRVGGISGFGLLELSRQRMRPSLESSHNAICRACDGRGFNLTPESVLLDVMRRLTVVMQRDDLASIDLTVSPDVAFHLLNRKRAELTKLETRSGIPVLVRVGGQRVDHVQIMATLQNGGALEIDPEHEADNLPPLSEDAYVAAGDLRVDDSDAEPIAEEDAQDLEAEVIEDLPPDDFTAPIEGLDDDEDEHAVDEATDEEDDEEEAPKKKRRRRRRGGRRRRRKSSGDGEGEADENSAGDSDPEAESQADVGGQGDAEQAAPTLEDDEASDAEDAKREVKKKPRRRRSRKKTAASSSDEGPTAESGESTAVPESDSSSDAEAKPDAEVEPQPKLRKRRARKAKPSAAARGEAGSTVRSSTASPRRRSKASTSDGSASAPSGYSNDIQSDAGDSA